MTGIWVRVGALSFCCPHSPLNRTTEDLFPGSPSFVIMDQLSRQRVSWLFILWGWSARECTWWNVKGWAPTEGEGETSGNSAGVAPKGQSCAFLCPECHRRWTGSSVEWWWEDGLWARLLPVSSALPPVSSETLDKSPHLLGRSWQHPLQVV